MAATVEGHIHQVNISRGGVPKTAVAEAQVTEGGIVGDWHDDVRDHGGPMRALCLYTLEEIERLAGDGHPIFPGATGENVTLRGLPLAALTPGAQLMLGGETLIQITGYASPCKTITAAFNDGDFTRISEKLHPGESRVYARVLREGAIRPGDVARIVAPGELRAGQEEQA